MLTARLITSLGSWLHPDVYERLPVLGDSVVLGFFGNWNDASRAVAASTMT